MKRPPRLRWLRWWPGLGAIAVAALVAAGLLASDPAGDMVETIVRVDVDGDRARGTHSAPRLPTAPFPHSGPFRRAEVWAVGDGADGSLAAKRVVRLIASAAPDRLLYLGDVYEDGTRVEFRQNYASTWGRLATITAPTLGNHEATNVSSGYGLYWRSIYGEKPPSFYSFRAAGWEILSLNSEIPHGPRSRQLWWLREKVSPAGDCRIAFWHRPRFSAGTTHGDDPGVAPLWRALRGRARLVVNAHEHNMQRLAARAGIVEVVVGSGGSERYGIDPSYPGLRFADAANPGGLRIRLQPGRAALTFVRSDGVILDRSKLRCSPGSR